MKSFDVQGIDLNVPPGKAFAYIADPTKLPKWTNAFASVSAGRAVMRTPGGEVVIDLEVEASPEHGTIDWRMTFPDSSLAAAFSRVVAVDQNHSIFSFVLTPPPVPLEQLEGALEAQSRTLAEELKKLKKILEHHG
ncbi:MAG TPA: SRPBCC family protein [Pyrinomonadaceae bacterium]|jgi:uncharacterized protein YndB with AHSA1/START domain|nr:SRPBCC family protein [Pyrinomonadaceae bacterium]